MCLFFMNIFVYAVWLNADVCLLSQSSVLDHCTVGMSEQIKQN